MEERLEELNEHFDWMSMSIEELRVELKKDPENVRLKSLIERMEEARVPPRMDQ